MIQERLETGSVPLISNHLYMWSRLYHTSAVRSRRSLAGDLRRIYYYIDHAIVDYKIVPPVREWILEGVTNFSSASCLYLLYVVVRILEQRLIPFNNITYERGQIF